MVVFIGQTFLSHKFRDTWLEDLNFYGANHITANSWQVSFSKEVYEFDKGISLSTPFLLNIDEGSSLRIPDYFVYKQKDGSIGTHHAYIMDYTKGQLPVSSVKFVRIGQDFIEVEYRLAK